MHVWLGSSTHTNVFGLDLNEQIVTTINNILEAYAEVSPSLVLVSEQVMKSSNFIQIAVSL